MPVDIGDIVSRLERVTGPNTKGWYTALCPFHDDREHPNLGFTENGFSCLACGAKGALSGLAIKVGVDHPAADDSQHFQSRDGVTLARLAAAKSLPLEHLLSLGWNDIIYGGTPAVSMPCVDVDGNVLRSQLRVRLETGSQNDRRFLWAEGEGVWPFGLDQLDEARRLGYIVIVEGATDYAACTASGVAALGVPGSDTWKSEWTGYLRDVPKVIVWKEPDGGGDTLVNAVAQSRPDVRVIDAPPEAKDACELRQLLGDDFKDRMEVLISSATPPTNDAKVGATLEDQHQPRRPSTADRAIKYVHAVGAELFHDQHGDSFIAFRNNFGRREIWSIRSKAAAEYIRWCFYRNERRGLSGEVLATTRASLSAEARFDGERRNLNVRVARVDETVWYDLGDGRAVAVTPKGWRVVEDPPILFRHYPHQAAQVEPRTGGQVGSIFDVLNVKDENTRLLLQIYLVTSLLCDIPLPILVVHGEQGSAKSFLFRILRALVDPSALDTLSSPDNYRDFVQLAAHHRAIYLDNLTTLPLWLSDALCRLCTGDGFSKRELYTDDDDIIYRIQGLGGLNGINLVAVKPDLLDRSLILGLEPIADYERRLEEELWAKFQQIRPQVLGAMFDTLSGALRTRDQVNLEYFPRLADFTKYGAAAAEQLGSTAHEFQQAYQVNIASQNQAALEESLVSQALLAMLEVRLEWEGTASELHQLLEENSEEFQINTKARSWPKAANVLARRLRESAPNLRTVGVSMEERKSNSRKIWRIARRDKELTDLTVPIDLANREEGVGSKAIVPYEPTPQSAEPAPGAADVELEEVDEVGKVDISRAISDAELESPPYVEEF